MNVCKPFANYSTKSCTLFHCSGLQGDVCPVILLVSILRPELDAHQSHHKRPVSLTICPSHTPLLLASAQTVHKLKHIGGRFMEGIQGIL